MHMDSDIYESTKIVLDELNEYISRDTILQFDEYFNYEAYREHEYRAFMEFVDRYNKEFEYIGKSGGYPGQVAVRIL